MKKGEPTILFLAVF